MPVRAEIPLFVDLRRDAEAQRNDQKKMPLRSSVVLRVDESILKEYRIGLS
jgi:hypothetical protein